MENFWERRAFLGTSVTGLLEMSASPRHLAHGAEVRRETYTYKTIGDCELKADVVRESSTNRLPIAVWIHGGALIMGDRRGVDRVLRDELVNAGYAVVSIDYRLAPETKLAAILEDVQDAFAWIRKEAPNAFGARVDRIAVLGGSAGGYLTLCSGFLVDPHPAALVSFWGYGDIAGNWYSRPDPFYRRQPLVSESEARAEVGTKAISEAPPQRRRNRFYLYCRQNGLWPKEVTGHDPDAEPKAFDAFCPLRNISPGYPPTLLVHGTDDTDVPYEQSVLMDQELGRHRVAHELITVPRGGHGLSNVDRAQVLEIYRRVLAFIRRSTG
jgi:acetyl esterase/lipase